MAGIPEFHKGYVTGRFVLGIEDTDDPDTDPDIVPLRGYVEFSSSAPVLRVDSATLGPLTMVPRMIRVDLDSEGYLVYQGSRQIALWATDDEDVNPINWQWHAEFHFEGPTVGTMPVGGVFNPSAPLRNYSLPAFNFELPGGATVDLTTVAPLETPSPGTIIIRGPKGDPGDGSGEGGDGETPQLRTSGGKVQTKLPSQGAWTDLYTIPVPADGEDGDDGQSATVTLVPAANWPPAADSNPLHLYVKVP